MERPGEQRARVVDALQGYAAGISELGRLFARRSRMHVSDSAAILEVLRAEDRGQPLTPARLAERIGLSSGATSILLNRLERAGHIVRTHGHADRRRVTLHSTPQAHTTAEAYFAPLRARLDALLDHYPAEQLAVVETLVGELRAAVDEYVVAPTDDD